MLDNKEFLKLIKDSYINALGNDILGMHRGIAMELGTYTPTLYKTPLVILWNEPSYEYSIEIKFVIKDTVLSYVFNNPDKVTTSQSIPIYLNGTVANPSSSAYTNIEYNYNNDIMLYGTEIAILPNIQKEIIIAYIKEYPYLVLEQPNNDETLVSASNITVQIAYSTFDGNGVLRKNIGEEHHIDISPLDQIERYNNDIGIEPIHPKSKMAEHAIAIYKLADHNILNNISIEKYESIINELTELDVSTWKDTKNDITFFDEKYASMFIVRPTEFDASEFDNERIELTL